MFSLNNLPKTTEGSSKRLGRGYGSGKGGHTSSRGQKGQKSRETAKLLFEGTKTNKDFFRRTPMLRGKSKLKSFNDKYLIIKSSALSVFADGAVVDMDSLVKLGLISQAEASNNKVKILFDKDPEKKLDIKVTASKTVLNIVKTA